MITKDADIFLRSLLTGKCVSRARRTSMGVRVVVGEGEPIELALKRFKRKLERSGVRPEVRWRVYFVDRTEIRRAKKFQKRFKARHQIFLAQIAGELRVSSLTEAKAEFWRRTGKP